jgi:hypothetical protein
MLKEEVYVTSLHSRQIDDDIFKAVSCRIICAQSEGRLKTSRLLFEARSDIDLHNRLR